MKIFVFLLILISVLGAAPVCAQEQDSQESQEIKTTTGAVLPRFASMRADEVNMRTGPGTRYPIDWVFKRQGMPIEITAEYDMWRRIKDWEGAEGWVHKAVLSGKRTAIVTGTERALKKSDAVDAAVVANLMPGAVGQLVSCEKEWCRLKFDGIKGYLLKAEFWGVYPNEQF